MNISTRQCHSRNAGADPDSLPEENHIARQISRIIRSEGERKYPSVRIGYDNISIQRALKNDVLRNTYGRHVLDMLMPIPWPIP